MPEAVRQIWPVFKAENRSLKNKKNVLTGERGFHNLRPVAEP
jgi:hypothetical protein